jgi:hypothetical protein
MPFGPNDIDDLALSVKEGVQKRGTWSDISLPYVNFVFPRFMEEGKLPLGKNDGSGTTMTFRVQIGNTNTFRITGMFDTNNTARGNVLKRGTVLWSKQDVSFTYDVDEPEFNTDDEDQVLDHLDLKMHEAWNSFYLGMEAAIFSQPSGPDEAPFGILGFPHWLVLDTTSNGAFTGGNPTGFTAGAAGLDSATYTGWDNYTFGFDAIGWDFVDQLFKAFFKTKFKAPHKYKQSNTGKNGFFFMTGYDNVSNLRKLLRGANENYGKEVMGFADVVLNSQEIEPSDYLTENFTNDIFYAVNKAHLGFKSQPGKSMKWTDPIRRPDAYSVRDQFMPNWMQGWCDNRREAGFVAARR